MREHRGRIARVVGVAVVAVALLLAGLFTAGKMLLARYVTYSRASIGLSRAAFNDLTLRLKGADPVLRAQRLDVEYNLRDLLIGGHRAFGLVSLHALRPHVQVVHYADGSWNVPMPSGTSKPMPSIGPLVFSASIRDGEVTIDDRTRIHPRSRHIEVARIELDARIDQRAHSSYTASAALLDGGRAYPVAGRGTMDESLGYELNRWTAPALPIASLISYALNSKGISVADGMLHDIDARYFGLPGLHGAIARHLSASAYLDGTRVYLGSLGEPIRGLHGPVYAYDDGITTPQAAGTFASMPFKVAGGVFDLSAPQLRIGVRTRGSLAQAARLSPAVAKAGATGAFALSLFIEGAAATPVILAQVASNEIRYKGYPIRDVRALAALSGTEADLIAARAGYNGIALYASGRTLLDVKRAYAQGFVHLTAPASSIPYAGSILPGLTLNAAAVAEGRADAFTAGGLVEGGNGTSSIAGTFSFRPDGSGSIGPVEIARGPSSLYARMTVDRAHGDEFALADLRDFPVSFAKLAARLDGGGAAALHGRTLESAGGTLHGRVAGGTLLALANYAGRDGLADLAVHGVRLRGHRLEASSSVRLHDARLQLHGATANYDGALAMLDGSASGVIPGASFKPRYDLRARVLGVDLGSLAGLFGRRLPPLEGSLDTNLRVAGSGGRPEVDGAMEIPVGFVNGLGFRNAAVALSGTPAALRAGDGHVTVGGTSIGFDGSYGGGGLSFAARAPQLNLADFDGYFDVAESLAGTGSATLDLRLGPGGTGSDGNIFLQNARYRTLPLGTTQARWHTAGNSVIAGASLGGSSGTLALAGALTLPASEPQRDTMRRSNLDLRATAQRLDLAAYLPAAGIETPVTGLLDAQATIRGRYPELGASAHAALTGGTIGRLRLREFTLDGGAQNGRLTLSALRLESDHLSVSGNGTAGLRASDPLDLHVQASVDDLGALYKEALGGTIDASGRLGASIAITGTQRDPLVHPVLSFDDLRYRSFAVPHAGADVLVTRREATIRSADVDFTKGRLAGTGLLPFTANAPIALALDAEDIDLAAFEPLLQKGTHLAGALDGRVTVSGTRRAPQLGGALALANGRYDSPSFLTPLTAIHGTLAFAGDEIRFEDVGAKAGGGTVALAGEARVPDLRAPIRGLSFHLNGNVHDAMLDLPRYFKGNLNAEITASRAPAAGAVVAGSVSVDRTRIPANILIPSSSGKPAARLPFNVALNLNVAAGDDVRVQNGMVDVGVTGRAKIGGSLTAPTIAGAFDSTGGTVDLYRDFRVLSGHVAFTPAGGLMPTVNALAETTVPDPETDIRMRITGQVPHLNLHLTSSPSYSREQILGLLLGVQALGAVNGVAATGGSTQSIVSPETIASEGEGILAQQLTRNLFAPLSSGLGDALGLSDLQLYLDPTSGFEARASKGLGKNLSAVFSQTVGMPSREEIGLRYTPAKAEALQLTLFRSTGVEGFGASNQTFLQSLSGTTDQTLDASASAGGTSGYTISAQRRF